MAWQATKGRSEIAGQDAVVGQFVRAASLGRIAGSYLFSGLDCREQGVVEPKTKIERGFLLVSEKQLAMVDQLVHRARYRAAERGSELDEPSSWRDETVVRKCQAIRFHELPKGGQDARDEDAVVRDSLGVEHDRVECLCIADKDGGSAVSEEQMARPGRA